MSDGKVSQWFRQFKDGQTNVHDEDHSGHKSVMHDNLVEIKSTTRFVKTGSSQFHSYRCIFHKFHIYYSMKLCQRVEEL